MCKRNPAVDVPRTLDVIGCRTIVVMLLPADPIDHIFSFLRGDRPTLKACSEAHSLYARLAERHLYADIVVRTKNPSAVSELHKKLSNDSHILDYARTLEIDSSQADLEPPRLVALSIMSMIPRMANLISLTLCEIPCSHDMYEDFLSTFRTCLQQSTIEAVCLYRFYDFPLSVLDSCKSLKKLTLSDCTAMPDDRSGSPHQSLETLRICGDHNSDLLFWTMGRVTHLTSLELRNVMDDYDWTTFSELLTACSNSLKRLQLGVGSQCMRYPSICFQVSHIYICPVVQSTYSYCARYHGESHLCVSLFIAQ